MLKTRGKPRRLADDGEGSRNNLCKGFGAVTVFLLADHQSDAQASFECCTGFNKCTQGFEGCSTARFHICRAEAVHEAVLDRRAGVLFVEGHNRIDVTEPEQARGLRAHGNHQVGAADATGVGAPGHRLSLIRNAGVLQKPGEDASCRLFGVGGTVVVDGILEKLIEALGLNVPADEGGIHRSVLFFPETPVLGVIREISREIDVGLLLTEADASKEGDRAVVVRFGINEHHAHFRRR